LNYFLVKTSTQSITEKVRECFAFWGHTKERVSLGAKPSLQISAREWAQCFSP